MGAVFFVSSDISINTNMEVTLMEIHNLAYFYHWDYQSCWHIPCTERGVFNDQIRKQLKAESRSYSSSKSGNSNPKSYKESGVRKK